MTGWEERRTRRWRGVVALALAALAAGLLLKRPGVLLLAVVGVAFAVYPRVTTPPQPALSIERRLSPDSPQPGDDVEVTVTLTNAGDAPLYDVRLVDGVPTTLAVAEGSPRHGAVLRSGRSTTFSYTVTAERGRHRFDPATVVARDVTGEHEVESTVAAETEIDCTASASAAPLRSQTLAALGRTMADRGGAGIEFHRTREYQRGDAMSRIDWNRYARTGEPTTIEFREARAAAVVLLVDAREAAYRSRDGEPHAVAYDVSAAMQVAEWLLERRNHVGVAGLGRSLAWVPPGAGQDQLDDIETVLATHGTFAPTPSESEPPTDAQFEDLRGRLPERAQVVLFSPLCDDAVVAGARALEVRGHAVSVVTPTVTETDTPERRLAAAERRHRITELRGAGVPAVEWAPDRPLAAAVDDAAVRWSG
jgi:uncharacterized repeat protein (TIGR01451 family)